MLVNFLNLSLLSALVLPLVTLAAPRDSVSKRQNDAADYTDGHNLTKRFNDVRMTFYDVDNGHEVSCGGFHKNNEPIVALSTRNMEKKFCGRRIKITANKIERSAIIVDTCMICPEWGIDLARGFFTDFERESVGVIHGDWVFEDGSPSPPPPSQSLPPPPPPPSSPPPPKKSSSPSPPTQSPTSPAAGPPSPSSSPIRPAAASPSPTPSDSSDPLCDDKDEPSPTKNPTPPSEISPSPQPSIPSDSPFPSDLRETSATLPATTSTRPDVSSSSTSSNIPATASPLGSMGTSGALSVLAGAKEMIALVATIPFAFYCL